MKYNLIKTDDYLLICDDSYINNGDKVLYNDIDILTTLQFDTWFTKWDFVEKSIPPVNYIRNCKKIIAHLPLNGAPVLDDVPVLPSISQKDDVDVLADEASQKFKRNDELDDLILGVSANSFEEGYNKAREKYKFTEEDVIRIVEKSRETGLTAEYLMLSYQQPKYPISFECEIEPEYKHIGAVKDVKGSGDKIKNKNAGKPKTITNSDWRYEWVGKYIWE